MTVTPMDDPIARLREAVLQERLVSPRSEPGGSTIQRRNQRNTDAALDAVEAERAALLAVVEACEWGDHSVEARLPCCPICGWYQAWGHQVECAFNAIAYRALTAQGDAVDGDA